MSSQETDQQNLSYFNGKLRESMVVASESGYGWICDNIHSRELSLLELLCMQAGLMSKVRFPLFYFRLSGGPISDTEPVIDTWKEEPENVNATMERLKQKLIRNGLPIRFYGSAAEFNDVVEKDLRDIIAKFPDKTIEEDNFVVDQKVFEKEKLKYFSKNPSIYRILEELDCFYSNLLLWTKPKESPDSDRIDVIIEDFYRKDFSEKLQNVYKKMRNKIASPSSIPCEGIKILILSGSRCSGKSTILANWLSYKEDKSIQSIIHYCDASYASSDLRVMLRRLINNIRSKCGYGLERDGVDIHSLNCELRQLNQEFYGAMLLSQRCGIRLLIVIDGLDHLGDRYVQSSNKIKDIQWIPEIIPDNVRIILTCATSDYSLLQLEQHRDDVKVSLTMSEANVDEDMIRSGLEGLEIHVGNYSQTCPETMLRNLTEWPLICNPLVQKLVAHVHHTMGCTPNWETFLTNISECHSIVELVRRILKLWVTFLNWEVINVNEKSLKKKTNQRKDENEEDDSFVKGWIPDCLSLIVMARNGVLVKALPSLLTRLGYAKEFQVSESDIWSLFHVAQGIMLRYHNGKLLFSQSLCKEIVAHTFMAIANCGSVEARTQESFDSMYTDRRCKFHLLLAHLFWTRQSEEDGNMEECIYHLDKASEYQTLATIILHPKVVLSLFEIEWGDLDLWLGQVGSIHRFLYYWQLLTKHGYELTGKLRDILCKYFSMTLDLCVESVVTDDCHSRTSVSFNSDKKTSIRSDFAQKLRINYQDADENEIFSSFSKKQSLRYLFLMGQMAALIKLKSLAREIYSKVINMSDDTILVCHVMWADINLESDWVQENSYLISALSALDNLSAKVIEEDTDIMRIDSVLYLRCLTLFHQCSLSPSILCGRPLKELKSRVSTLRSIVVTGRMLELESDFIQISDNFDDMNTKLALLLRAIVTLETWTGPLDLRLATLWMKLGNCYKYGNYRSRLKAEACYRRAMHVWSCVRCDTDDSYLVAENRCRELLMGLLLQDLGHNSVSEAKIHLFTTYDCRVKSLGCDHPDTKRLAPLIKMVSTLEVQMGLNTKVNGLTSQKKSGRHSLTLFRNDSNSNMSERRQQTTDSSDLSQTRSNKSAIRASRPMTASSNLQFINRYSNDDNIFQNDIDWNSLAEGGGYQTRSSNVSAVGRRSVSRSTRTDLLSCDLNTMSWRASSSSMSHHNTVPKHVYSGHNSSLSYNDMFRKTNQSRHSKSSKEVRFSAALGNDHGRQQLSDTMQAKLSHMEITKGHNWMPRKKAFSAVFSRPYYSISDPMS